MSVLNLCQRTSVLRSTASRPSGSRPEAGQLDMENAAATVIVHDRAKDPD